MARRNRVDPWGDLHEVGARGMFTGNRGCLVDGNRKLVRHHQGSLWIVCRTEYRDWRHPLDAPRTWTPLFFLDDAVALAAGHRPCGLCRRTDYLAYRRAVTEATGAETPILATELNMRLSSERLARGRGISRANDRILWRCDLDRLPVGTVIAEPATGEPHLVTAGHLQLFGFEGWRHPTSRPKQIEVDVITPPTSVAALQHAFTPVLHPSAV